MYTTRTSTALPPFGVNWKDVGADATSEPDVLVVQVDCRIAMRRREHDSCSNRQHAVRNVVQDAVLIPTIRKGDFCKLSWNVRAKTVTDTSSSSVSFRYSRGRRF